MTITNQLYKYKLIYCNWSNASYECESAIWGSETVCNKDQTIFAFTSIPAHFLSEIMHESGGTHIHKWRWRSYRYIKWRVISNNKVQISGHWVWTEFFETIWEILIYLKIAESYKIFQNFMTTPANFDRECQNKGSLLVKLLKKGGHSVTTNAGKGSIDRSMTYIGQWEYPQVWTTTETTLSHTKPCHK